MLRRLGVVIVLIATFAPDVSAQSDSRLPTWCCSTRRILTVDDAFRTAAALAVRDGRFVAVGSNDEVRRHIGPATRVIEGRGRTVVPGFIDTHVHALDVASAEATQPFVNLRSIAELQDWLRTEAPRRPQGSWIWTPRTFPTRLREHRFPTRQELDAAAPDHPVVVDSAYAFALNTAALRAAGITRDSAESRRRRDREGRGRRADRSAEERRRPARALSSGIGRGAPLDTLERVHRQYLAAGITSVIERGATLPGFETYRRLEGRRTPARARDGDDPRARRRRCGRRRALHRRAAVQVRRGRRMAEGGAAQARRGRRHPDRHVVHAKAVRTGRARAVRASTIPTIAGS